MAIDTSAAVKATNANIQNRVQQAVEKSVNAVKAERLSWKELQLEARRAERKENMNPPDDQPFSRLACAVIYSVAKNWRNSGNPDQDKIANRHIVDFFTGPDYLFWRNFTEIKVDGADIVAALAENGGLQMPLQIVHVDWGNAEGVI